VSCVLFWRVKDIGDAAIENYFIESTIVKIPFLQSMKRIIIFIGLSFFIGVQALSGTAQIKVE